MSIKTKKSNQKTNPSARLGIIGLIAYLLIIGIFSLLLLTEPVGFNVPKSIPVLLAFLFISGIGLGYWIVADAKNKNIAALGVISFAIVFTFIGLFTLAALGWLIAVSHL